MTIPFDPSVLDISGIPHYSWDQFMTQFVWNQGEHMAAIGPTNSGKTTLIMKLLPRREYVTVLATKPKDDNLDRFEKLYGYKKLTVWKPRLSHDKYPKRILWPDATDLNQSRINQKRVFGPALSDIFGQGSWCVYMDELWWMSYVLGMGEEVKIYLQQGRSLGLSLVCSTQRPAWVPLEIYDQSTHLFFWSDNDKTNLNRISGIGSFDSDAIRARIMTLQEHEVLYVNTRGKYMCTFFPPAPGELKEVTK